MSMTVDNPPIPRGVIAAPAPSGSAAADTAAIEKELQIASEKSKGVVRIDTPGMYKIGKELPRGAQTSVYIGPETTLQAAEGFVGSSLLSDPKATLSSYTSIWGGGTLDSNNIAAHALLCNYFKRIALGVQCKNSLEDDVILGDLTAPAASFECYLNDDFFINRDAGAVPVGHYALWIRNTSDGRASNGVVVKGQETGIRVDKGGWKWFGAHPYGAGFPMQVCADDNAGVEWYGSNFDTPTMKEHGGATGEAGSTVINDTEILAQHFGRPVYGANIPAESQVGAVTPGVGFTLVNKKNEAIKPTGAVAGVTLAGVGILLRVSGFRILGGQTFMSGTYGADNTSYGAIAVPSATGVQGVILGKRANATNNEKRLRAILGGNLTKVTYSNLLQNNVVSTIAGQNPNPAALLAVTQYAPGVQEKFSTESKELVAISEEHLSVTFTAPESGNVLVKLNAMVTQSTAADHVTWGLIDAGKVQHGPLGTVLFTNSASVKELAVRVTGLTPGESYTWSWAWVVNAGKGEMNAQNAPVPGSASSAPATMEVWAA